MTTATCTLAARRQTCCEGSGARKATLAATSDDRDFEAVAKAVREAIDKNEPEVGLRGAPVSGNLRL